MIIQVFFVPKPTPTLAQWNLDYILSAAPGTPTTLIHRVGNETVLSTGVPQVPGAFSFS